MMLKKYIRSNCIFGFALLMAMVLLGMTPANAGFIKICKVAGPGVVVGTDFTFSITGAPDLTLPAGPAPGGYCWPVNATYNDGDQVMIKETGPAGYGVTNIDVRPAVRQIGPVNLPAKEVTIIAGSGITEVTYTNERRFGYLEICKEGNVDGDFTFEIQPGNAGAVTVPAGACSPAIEVPAGEITIFEVANSGVVMSGCSTFPADRQLDCDLDQGISVVEVRPGDISTQTIAFIENRSETLNNGGTGNDGGRRRGSMSDMAKQIAANWSPSDKDLIEDKAVKTSVNCTPRPDDENGLMTCVAKVMPSSAVGELPLGMINFVSSEKTLAVIPLNIDGTATLALPIGMVGAEGLAASFLRHNIPDNGSDEDAVRTKIYRPGEPSPTDNEADRLNRKALLRLHEKSLDAK